MYNYLKYMLYLSVAYKFQQIKLILYNLYNHNHLLLKDVRFKKCRMCNDLINRVEATNRRTPFCVVLSVCNHY